MMHRWSLLIVICMQKWQIKRKPKQAHCKRRNKRAATHSRSWCKTLKNWQYSCRNARVALLARHPLLSLVPLHLLVKQRRPRRRAGSKNNAALLLIIYIHIYTQHEIVNKIANISSGYCSCCWLWWLVVNWYNLPTIPATRCFLVPSNAIEQWPTHIHYLHWPIHYYRWL